MGNENYEKTTHQLLKEGKGIFPDEIDVLRMVADGKFDEAVYDRFCNSNNMIDRFCNECDHKCSDDCPGRRLRG